MSTKPVIYVTCKGKNQNAEPMMIKLSRSLKTIMEDAAAVLSRPPIKCLYDKDMNLITDVKQINPGDLVICSILPADQQKIVQPNKLNFSGMGNASPKGGKQYDSDDRAPSPTRNEKSPSRNSRASPEKSPQRLGSPSRGERSPRGRQSPSYQSKFDEDYQEEQITPRKEKNTSGYGSKGSASKSNIPLPPDNNYTPKIPQSSSSAEYPQHLSDVDVNYRDIQANSSHNENNDLEYDPNNAPDNISVQSKKKDSDARSVTAKLRLTREMLTNDAERIEEASDVNITKQLCQLVGEIPEHSQDLDKEALKILREHTFVTPVKPAGYSFTGRVAVVGPKQSGKSTFMKILSTKYIQLLNTMKLKKRTAVFIYDFDNFKKSTKNIFEFYGKFVQSSIIQLAEQYPLLKMHPQRKDAEDSTHSTDKTPILDELIRAFNQFTRNEQFKPLSHQKFKYVPFDSFYTDINALVENIQDSLTKPNGIGEFLTATFLLPSNLAYILGYSNVHFIIDHLEALDVDVKPRSPFATKENVSLINYVNNLLSDTSYFISCTEEEKLFAILDALELRMTTEIKSVIGLVSDQSELKDVKLELDDGSKVTLLFSYCGGCSGYISKWQDFAKLSASFKPKGKPTLSEEKNRLKLRSILNDLISILFSDCERSVVNFTVSNDKK